MGIVRMDHVGVVVDDLAAATDFFVALGMAVVGEGAIEGDFVGRIIGLEDVRSKVVMLETPDGASRIELSSFTTPRSPGRGEAEASNVPGLRHLCFQVDDLDATLERLREHGAELVGTVERYEDIYRLCYLRGPEDIIVELAQRLGE
jgi:catechol 2,3-dioxygenase-like lactoylglutathione lyase family enzyme